MDNREEQVLKRDYKILKDGTLLNPFGKTVGSISGKGYLKIQVTLFDLKEQKNKVKEVFLHRIQAFKKYGKQLYKEGVNVRHLDDNKLNNSYCNIAIGSSKDNYHDRGWEAINKLQIKATMASMKYTEEDIEKAKEYYKKSLNLKETARKFNIPHTTLHYRFYGKKKQVR